jgi:hypothetical protein
MRMFEVIASDRFAAWYEGLTEAVAEEVTLALDVAAGLGAGIDPVRSRPLLLWYDGMHGVAEPEPAAHFDRHVRLLMWGHRISSCLASPEFRARLAALEASRAQEVLLAVERVKNVLAGSRTLRLLGALESQSRVELSPAEQWLYELIVTERERAMLPGVRIGAGVGELRGVAWGSEGPEPIYLAVLEALRRVGLGPCAFLDERSGLRELVVRVGSELLRLICGVDVPRRRIVAILGEPLDRSYYGDSVRFAESYFRDYLAQQEPARAHAEEP